MLSLWYHRLKIPVLACILLTYFGFHGYHGNRGYLTRIHLEKEVFDLKEEYALLHYEKEVWQKQIHLMQLEHIDADYLEERARHVSAKIKLGEKIIMLYSHSNEYQNE